MNISRDQFVSEVAGVWDDYQPSSEVLSQLGEVDLTTVSSPTGMGKDSLILSTGIPRVVGETIREPRVNNGVMERHGVEYEFRGGELDRVLEDVKRGNHVQFGMGPGRNSFYGSRVGSYPKSGPALIDVMTNQVEGMRRLPFSSVESVMVVAPSYDTWQEWLAKRGPLSPNDLMNRRKEAVVSLEDGLSDDRYKFILNEELTIAGEALYKIAVFRDYDRAQEIKARNIASTIISRILADN